MIFSRNLFRTALLVVGGLGIVVGCGFDDTLREYLSIRFWLPFSRGPMNFEKTNIRRISVPFAGMISSPDRKPLSKLRSAYQKISQPETAFSDRDALRQLLSDARADQSVTLREREEIDLIDAKIDMRAGDPDEPEFLRSAMLKFRVFLSTSKTPEFLSEARGWLAHVHYLLNEQTAAGKIYLDELNRNGSNLSRETLLNSLRMTYGYDGGQELWDRLEEYFDTPEHAAFAIQLLTNPRWNRKDREEERTPDSPAGAGRYSARLTALLEKHRKLFAGTNGSHILGVLSMRTALRAGDPLSALKIAAEIPSDASVRREPDFLWMLASAHFVSRNYAEAERPLLSLFRTSRATPSQKAAAAYGLCGVYQKLGNPVEQIHFALWLHTQTRLNQIYLSYGSGIENQEVYWASSGWDLGLLLDSEADLEALESFIQSYPAIADLRLVKYSLAVRLARENRYGEAADLYASIRADRRADRTRRLATLYEEASPTSLAGRRLEEARYHLAGFIAANPDRLYFNDQLWGGFQRYALAGADDGRLTREERTALLEKERDLKDQQEERWRAWLILRDVVHEEGQTITGRHAAQLATRCLRGISERFGRAKEIRDADLELSRFLKH